MRGLSAFGSCLAAVAAFPAFAQGAIDLASPDGSIRVSVASDPAQGVVYSVARRGETVIAASPLGMVFDEQGRTSSGAIAETGRASVDRRLPVLDSKTSMARDHYNMVRVRMAAAPGGTPVDLEFRAYDDGIAFRYHAAAMAKAAQLFGEKTGFFVAKDDRCWGSMVGSMTSSHESEYAPFRAADARPYTLYDMATLCRTPSGSTNLLFAEADLVNYPGMYLRGRWNGGGGFESRLSLLPGETRVAMNIAANQPVDSPWRVVLMADRAGDLIASNVIGNLNPQPQGDFSWVRPGKAAWDWWSGPYLPGIPPTPMSMPQLERLIDFAGASRLQYMLIDEGWALNSGVGGSAPADTDITRTKPDIDMPALVARAGRQGVDVMLWLQWRHLDARLDEALDQYVSWGVKGIKVDFMDRNDADMVAFYHRVIVAAAKRHLLVDFHGAYLPTGLNRTYPNYVTQEGVMGAEYNKWSNRITATHNVNLAFTRLVLGPMDYTPGGFRNVRPADFHPVNIQPRVQTTRGQALAMYVVFDSPVSMVSDSPDVYEGQPEFAFIRDVPTIWDETRFVGGEPDSHVIVARRKGSEWFVGGMNTETARTASMPLRFLGTGRWRASVWQDGDVPAKVVPRTVDVDAGGDLDVPMAPSGGFAIRFSRLR